MDNTTHSLIDLNESLISRVEELEREGAELRKKAAATVKDLQVKLAAAEKRGNVVSGRVADETVAAMLKTGALSESQVSEARARFLTDAEAPHRVLQKLLDVQLQSKTASSTDDSVSGGRLVNTQATVQNDGSDCFDRMMNILNRD